jgi:hypothetical protein
MTKLLSPNLRVTLSQVPPSQKEMWGAEGTPRFPVRPHTHSIQLSLPCEPTGVLHWLAIPASPLLEQRSVKRPWRF